MCAVFLVIALLIHVQQFWQLEESVSLFCPLDLWHCLIFGSSGYSIVKLRNADFVKILAFANVKFELLQG